MWTQGVKHIELGESILVSVVHFDNEHTSKASGKLWARGILYEIKVIVGQVYDRPY
jgi:hypothetical protein